MYKYYKKGESSMRHELFQKIVKKIKNEEVVPIESDEEYFVTLGALLSYLGVKKNKQKNFFGNQRFINQFLNAKDDREIKDALVTLMKKVSHEIPDSRKVKNLIAMVVGYEPDDKINGDLILFGFSVGKDLFK